MPSAKRNSLAPRLTRRLPAVAGALLMTCIPGAALAQTSGSTREEAKPAKLEPAGGAKSAERGPAPREASTQSPPATDTAGAEKPEASAEAGDGFVDRDGDGIQDGQEHRFRRRGSGARSSESDSGAERRQTRYRGGDGRGGPNGNGPRK
jgi:hypothetical protein